MHSHQNGLMSVISKNFLHRQNVHIVSEAGPPPTAKIDFFALSALKKCFHPFSFVSSFLNMI